MYNIALPMHKLVNSWHTCVLSLLYFKRVMVILEHFTHFKRPMNINRIYSSNDYIVDKHQRSILVGLLSTFSISVYQLARFEVELWLIQQYPMPISIWVSFTLFKLSKAALGGEVSSHNASESCGRVKSDSELRNQPLYSAYLTY